MDSIITEEQYISGTPVVEYEWKKVEMRTLMIPSMRSNGSMVMVDGDLWLICGRGSGLFNEVWRFSAKDCFWEHVTCLGFPPSPRDGHTATKIEGTDIIVYGGRGVSLDRSDRVIADTQKVKSYTQRECFNETFLFQTESRQWTQLLRKSQCPSGRRGHSAVFLPAEQTRGQIRGHKASSKVSFPSEYPDNTKGLLVVYGGATVEAAWGTEQLSNELWVFNIETGVWNYQKHRGATPPPMYEHSAILVSDQIVIVGGIVAPHRSASGNDEESKRTDGSAGPATDGNDPSFPKQQLNSDVIVLNTKTWCWSSLILINANNGKSASICLHGHSMVQDPSNENQVLIFGGRETGNWRAVVEHREKRGDNTMSRKRRADENVYVINVAENTFSTLHCMSRSDAIPEGRYGHVTVAPPAPPKDEPEPTSDANKKKVLYQRAALSEPKEVDKRVPVSTVMMYVFGGSKSLQGGFCKPDLHYLVKTTYWDDNRDGGGYDDLSTTSTLPSTPGPGRSSSVRGASSLLDLDSPREFEELELEMRSLSKLKRGKVPLSYNAVKRGLLISKSIRVHDDELKRLGEKPGSRPSSRTGSRSGRRPQSASSRKSGSQGRPFTAPGGQLRPGSSMEYSVASGDWGGNRTGSPRKVPEASVLAEQLPSVISGMTLNAAREEFHRRYPKPTKESVFGVGHPNAYSNFGGGSYGDSSVQIFRPKTT